MKLALVVMVAFAQRTRFKLQKPSGARFLSASNLCWAAGARWGELAVGVSSVCGVVVGRCCQQRSEYAEGVRVRPAGGEAQAVVDRAKQFWRRAEGGESVGRSEVAEASSGAEPVVFDHGREEGVHQSPGSLALMRAGGNGAVSFSRPVAEDEAWRTVDKTLNAA